MKKIHPEMQELLQKEMQRHLRYDSDFTPQQIEERLRKRMAAFEAPLRNAKQPLIAETVWECDCLKLYYSHLPWCDKKAHVEFRSDPNIVWTSAPGVFKREGV